MPTCIHGQLARSCDLCESDQKDAVIMSLEGTVARLTAENARMRRVVEFLQSAHPPTHNWEADGCVICEAYAQPEIAALDAKEWESNAE